MFPPTPELLFSQRVEKSIFNFLHLTPATGPAPFCSVSQEKRKFSGKFSGSSYLNSLIIQIRRQKAKFNSNIWSLFRMRSSRRLTWKTESQKQQVLSVIISETPSAACARVYETTDVSSIRSICMETLKTAWYVQSWRRYCVCARNMINVVSAAICCAVNKLIFWLFFPHKGTEAEGTSCHLSSVCFCFITRNKTLVKQPKHTHAITQNAALCLRRSSSSASNWYFCKDFKEK